MSAPVADRLWPMLLALASLIGGALALQGWAERRGNEEIVVAIHETTAVDTSEDAAADEEDAPPLEGPVDDDHARAQTAARRGELEPALALYQKAIAAHPTVVSLKDEYGYWLFQANRKEDARRVLEEARALAPDDAGVALHLGRVYARMDAVAEAEVELRRAVSLRKNFSPAQRALGTLLRRKKDYASAIQVLSEAASSGSNEERARSLLALGLAQLAAGKADEAERSFERAIEFAPARAEIRIGVGRAWLASDDPVHRSRARDVLARAAELAPGLPQVHALLGRALERAGERAEAVSAFERALQLDPAYHSVRRRLIRIALDQKDLSRARAHAEVLLADAPDQPEHHFFAAQIADREDRDKDARRHYEEAIARAHGDYPEAWFNLGLMEKRNGRLAEAIAAYEKALALRPDYLSAQNNLALAKDAAGDPAAAEELLRRALAQHPTYAAGLLNLGEVVMRAGRHEEAAALFQRAIDARPGYLQARMNLGLTLRKLGRPAEAVAALRALVEENPRHLAGWIALAEAAGEAGQMEQATQAAKAALAIDPDHTGALRTFAELKQRAEQWDEALNAWQELLDHDPANRTARVALAELQLKRGDVLGCARTAQALLNRSPGDADARRLHDRCARRTEP